MSMMVTQNELALLAMWGDDALMIKLKGMNWRQAMAFRRELQVACTVYAKTHSMDEVQRRVMQMTSLIETMCWRTYWRFNHKRRLKNDPAALRMGPKGLKIALRAEWEKLCKKLSY